MRKNLLLLFLCHIWWLALAQSPGQQKVQTLQVKGKQLENVSISNGENLLVLGANDADQALPGQGQPAYWPDRVYVKLKSSSEKLPAYNSKTSSAAARRTMQASTDKVTTTLRKFSPSIIEPLRESPKTPSLRNTYEVVVEKAEGLDNLLTQLNQLPEVEYAERVPQYYFSTSPNDPQFVSNQQYYLAKTRAIEAMAIHRGTAKTLLAIVDDGLLFSHPDLNANIDVNKSIDIADGDRDTRPPAYGRNMAGPGTFSHGTHCAGIAGAVVNNGEGIASISNNRVTIIGVKATSDSAVNIRSITYGFKGILYAIDQGARVISMSFGGAGRSQTVQNAINDAAINGVVFVASAGNDNGETLNYPAAYDNVIAVASSDQNDAKSSFSNFGTWVDITAPGSSILSTVVNFDGRTGGYAPLSGTSMSTPMVAGMVALMLSENPNLTPQAVLQIMQNTADPIGDPLYAGKLGAGRINVLAAIQAIQALPTAGAPSAITNLQASQAQATRALLSWSAPGVGGATAATLYEMRYSTNPITLANFASATKSKTSIAPSSSGTAQTLLVEGLEPNTTYYFAVLARSFYGQGTLSNVASISTAPGARAQVSNNVLNFSFNRASGNTASQTLQVSNVGAGALGYDAIIVPTSGPGILRHGHPNAASDNSLGLTNGASFIAVAKFVAGPRGFTLSHVQNYLDNLDAGITSTIGVRVLRGGTRPANAAVIHNQNFTCNFTFGLSKQVFALSQSYHFQPGEVFWIAFVTPGGFRLYQGFDEVGAALGVFYFSSNSGIGYQDAQTIGPIFQKAHFKIGAINGAWLTLSPAGGSMAQGQSSELIVAADVSSIVNGDYNAEILLNSNDVLEPLVKREVRVTVSGGVSGISLDKSTVNFGLAYVGASRTQKVLIGNSGVSELVVTGATISGGTAKASDFSISPSLPFTILPDKTQEVTITFSPSVNQNLTGTLTFVSNDPAAPSKAITLAATLQSPPVMAVTPTAVQKTISLAGTGTGTEGVIIRNNGQAALDYNLQVQVEATNQISYDPEAAPTNFIGYNSLSIPTYVGMKFEVDAPSFNLSAVMSHYKTMTAPNKEILVRVYKGGTTPSAGILMLEQVFSSEASDGNGGVITIPLERSLAFVKNDVFWIVIRYRGVTHPQGTAASPSSGINFSSQDGAYWAGYSSGTFRIRAVGAPLWLTVAPLAGTLQTNKEATTQLSFNTSYISEGTYSGSLVVSTNDPNNLRKSIPISLTVTGSSPVADFTAQSSTVSVGQAVVFTNNSSNADAFEWTFEGGTPATSTATTPSVTYAAAGTYRVTLVAKNTARGTSSAPLVKENFISVVNYACNLLNDPFPGNAILYPVANSGGYMTGNNTYLDKAKANFFTNNVTGSYITGTKIFFGLAAASSADATVQVAVWSNTMALLASKSVKISDISADVTANRATEVIYDGPVAVTGNFYVGVVLNQNPGNTVAILSNRDGETTPGTAWRLDASNRWWSITEAWGLNLSLKIQPVLLRSSTAPVKPVISQAGNRLSSSAAIGNQWYFNGAAIAGAVLQTYTATENGKYTVKVSYSTCLDLLSDEMNVMLTGMAQALDEVDGLTLYPNPTHGKFTVSFTAKKPEKITLLLVNAVGKTLSKETVENFRGDYKKEFNLARVPAGIYVLKVQYGNKISIRRVVIE